MFSPWKIHNRLGREFVRLLQSEGCRVMATTTTMVDPYAHGGTVERDERARVVSIGFAMTRRSLDGHERAAGKKKRAVHLQVSRTLRDSLADQSCVLTKSPIRHFLAMVTAVAPL